MFNSIRRLNCLAKRPFMITNRYFGNVKSSTVSNFKSNQRNFREKDQEMSGGKIFRHLTYRLNTNGLINRNDINSALNNLHSKSQDYPYYYNLILSSCMNLKNLNNGERFDIMKSLWKNLSEMENPLTTQLYNTKLQVMLNCKVFVDPFNYLKVMKNNNLTPNQATYNLLISHCAHKKEIDSMTKLYDIYKTKNFAESINLKNNFIIGHLLNEDVETAYSLLDELKNSKNLCPDRNTFQIFLNYYAKNGNLEMFDESLKEMNAQEIHLNADMAVELVDQFIETNVGYAKKIMDMVSKDGYIHRSCIFYIMKLASEKKLNKLNIVADLLPFDHNYVYRTFFSTLIRRNDKEDMIAEYLLQYEKKFPHSNARLFDDNLLNDVWENRDAFFKLLEACEKINVTFIRKLLNRKLSLLIKAKDIPELYNVFNLLPTLNDPRVQLVLMIDNLLEMGESYENILEKLKEVGFTESEIDFKPFLSMAKAGKFEELNSYSDDELNNYRSVFSYDQENNSLNTIWFNRNQDRLKDNISEDLFNSLSDSVENSKRRHSYSSLDLHELKKLYETIPENDQDTIFAIKDKLAKKFYYAGEKTEFLKLYNEIEQNPSFDLSKRNSQVLVEMALRSYIKYNDFENAKLTLNKIPKDCKLFARCSLDMACISFRMNNDEEAMEYLSSFKDSTNLNSESTVANFGFMNLMATLKDNGKMDHVEKCFESCLDAIKVRNNFSEVSFAFIDTFLNPKNEEMIISLIKTMSANQILPQPYELFMKLDSSYSPEFLKEVNDIFSATYGTQSILLNSIFSCLKFDQIKDARKKLGQLISLDRLYLSNICRSCAENQDSETLKKFLEVSNDTSFIRRDIVFYYMLRALVRQGNYKQALDCLEKHEDYGIYNTQLHKNYMKRYSSLARIDLPDNLISEQESTVDSFVVISDHLQCLASTSNIEEFKNLIEHGEQNVKELAFQKLLAHFDMNDSEKVKHYFEKYAFYQLSLNRLNIKDQYKVIRAIS
ncbi:hypothetical protein A3Q56_00626 [Intoshia linei]|uniref:Pentacotripeptide-repeat region of PRORP domain-containing protein n=1 Tax=Intoshia linei TaxID=1819745 RepID=A0A177BBK8_9BILA|nr:hypothetical protein A3Q56_00626 [Intoshia linei]